MPYPKKWAKFKSITKTTKVMKKNVILGVFATTLAIGSVFASSALAPVTAWVKVRYQGQAPGVYTCTQSNKQCNQTAGIACKINVVTAAGTQAVTGYLPDTQTSSTCTNPILVQSSGAFPTGTFIPSGVPLEAYN